MTSLRTIRSAGLLVAASAAIAVSAAGTAAADASPPRIYASYGACMSAGNILAQQGQAHVFACVPRGAAPAGAPPSEWELIIRS
ncbi:hypothetical protein ATK36_0621 [Amycolatopsis sulphurea]|uniref:Uncharacterized protein n=1 Tax=Amycolatopsis sulphurea TaxID=76022 RepID=A0A2A9G0W5_9PSEU|nr:hypothetical protein [Amycolatopsis sulphurea]PFG57068.1 hypothetical protein ATK36_0621 [Amycolatopsis sulphurea]